ncbi:hypothetical protein ABHN84_10915 [Shewanella vesiculosa]|uniref:O-antigen ligase domain-containing protein n=1 Tax=Shewanella vesiculosa TaxID=518738 RepID=A0ABV0FTN6_9GAMM
MNVIKIERPIYLLFAISPFLIVLNYFFNPIPVSLIKEIIQLQVIFVLLLKLFKCKFNNFETFYLLFLLYFLLHIITLNNIELWLDGIRYQLGYMIIGILLIVNRTINVELAKLISILFYASLPVLFIAVFEFFDSSIIDILYGQSKYMLNHTELALGERLISTFGNPINLGVFLTIGFVSAVFMYKEKKLNLPFFSVYVVASFFVVLFTFSRIALISFLLVSLYLIFVGGSYIKKFILLIACVTLFYSVSLNFENLSYLKDFNIELMLGRFFDISNSSTYVENARVQNWIIALKNIDSIIFTVWGLGVGFINPNAESGGFIVENLFISILIEFGMVGLLLYFIHILYLLRASFKLKDNEQIFCVSFLMVFLISGLGNDLNRNFPFVFYFWIISAAIILKYRKGLNSE